MFDTVSAEDSGPVVVPDGSFTFGTRLGLVFIVEAAFLSLLSVLFLLVYILSSTVKYKDQRRWGSTTPLHVYFISMMFAELFQATGSIMNLKWVIEANVHDGSFCTAQGLMKQTGDVSVALATLAIAVHTFSAIVFRWVPLHPRILSAVVLSAIWLTIILIVIISAVTHRNDIDAYWGDTQYWCWVSRRYQVQQYALDYVFMWTTAFANIILYIPLALVIKGVVIVDGFSVKLRTKEERLHATTHSGGRAVDNIAMQMLFYPLVYTLTVLPIAIVRFRAFYDQHVPFAGTVVADVLFSCSGLFNVILFAFTRPSLLPRRESTLPSFHAFSSSFRSPGADRQTFSGQLSSSPERSQMGALPDDSEIYRFESRTRIDHESDRNPLEPSPIKYQFSPTSPSYCSQI